MKIVLAMLIFCLPLVSYASFSTHCDYSAEVIGLVPKEESKVEVSFKVLRRNFSTWIFGKKICNSNLESEFTTEVEQPGPQLGSKFNIRGMLICPDGEIVCYRNQEGVHVCPPAPDCFWKWNIPE